MSINSKQPSGNYPGKSPGNHHYHHVNQETALSQSDFGYLKSFSCPKCQRPYDIQLRGNFYVGRVPLILNCEHTICEDCVRQAFTKSRKEVLCGECHTATRIENAELKKRIQQIYPINFYLFGLLSYYKPHLSEMSGLNFKPAGYSLQRTGRQSDPRNLSYQDRAVHTFSTPKKPPESVQDCALNECIRPAEVNCADCDEIFCETCSKFLHKSARGLMKHKISPLNFFSSPELKTTCPLHKDSIIEFNCKTCHENLCCYCILGAHKEHDYYQMTQMTQEEIPEFKALITDAEEVLQKLKATEKRVIHHLNENSATVASNSIDVLISRCFENVHGKLQVLERQLRKEAAQYKNINYDTLINIRNDVSSNVLTLNSLIQSAKQVADGKENAKLNVKIIEERLTNALKIPCRLVHEKQASNNIQFICGNLLNDLKDNFIIKSDSGCSFFLVTEDEVPAEYEEEEISDSCSNATSEVLSSSLASSVPTLESPVEKSPIALRFTPTKRNRTDSVESWIKTVNEEKKSEVQMPGFKKGDRASVTITHINSPECFYVHLNSMVGTLNKLCRNIEVYIKNFAPPVAKPELNSLYLVKYPADKQWCRGRITEIIEKDSLYTVLFIDYGNTKRIKRQQIKGIPPELRGPSPFAIECKLFDIYPPKNEWDPKVINLMVHIVTGHDLLMVVMDEVNGALEVDIVTMEGNTSLRDALIFIGYGIPYIKSPTELDIIKKDLKTLDELKLFEKTVNYEREDSEDVVITFVIDPFNIYVTLNQSQGILNELQESMQDFYTKNKKGYVYAPKKGMVVAASYTDATSVKWYRGIITELTSGRGLVSVYLVDVGNTVSIPWNYIRRLNERFIALECQAMPVKLAHIKPIGNSVWPPNSIQFFDKYIANRTSLKMVVNETTKPIEVALFECFPAMHLCLNAILVRDSLAESTGELSKTVEWPQHQLLNAKGKETESFTLNMMKTIQASTQVLPQKGNEAEDKEMENVLRKPVDIVSAVDPGLIYVRFVDKKHRQHEFYLELQDYYSKQFFKTSTGWKKGDICVACYQKQYYRAVVLHSLPENKFKVSLRDIAQEVELDEKHMGVINEKFKQFPEFAIRCHLADVSPAGGTKKWPAMACEYLQEFFANKDSFYLTRKGVLDRQRKSMPVVIWHREFIAGGPLEGSKTIYHSINNLLLRNGLALKMRVTDKPDITEEAKDVDPKNDGAGEPADKMSNLTDWNEIMEEEFKETKEEIAAVTTDWLPPLSFKSDVFQAKPTSVNDKGEIFLHELEFDTVLDDMEKKMNEIFENSPPEAQNVTWSPGQVCTVKYFMNDNWYRGKILSNDEDSLKVTMVDFGNEEECELKDLRKKAMYLDIPPFANKVTLHNVLPKSGRWQTSDLDLLHAEVVDKQVTVTLKGKQILGFATPAVLHLDNVSINQFMIQKSPNLTIPLMKTAESKSRRDYARRPGSESDELQQNSDVDAQNESMSQSDSDVVVEDENVSSTETVESTDPEEEYQHIQLPPAVSEGSKVSVAIINLIGFNKVVLEIVGTTADKGLFDSLSKQMKEEAALQPVIENPRVDMPCVAQFSEDGEWYRAKICDINADDLNVWFVDFGNFECVPPRSIRAIKPNWLKVPVEQHLAVIHGIELANESCLDDVLEDMSTYFSTIVSAEIVSRSPLVVRLYDTDSNQLTYQNLIDKGLLVVKDLKE